MKSIKNILLILMLSLMMILTACNTNEEQGKVDEDIKDEITTEVEETERTVIDREGNEVVIKTDLERIISTAPSNTEVLVELGLGDKIIAVDNYSPLEGLDSDIVTIDFVQPDGETIIGLNPDIIIASGHNVSGGEDPFAIMKEAGIPVVYIPSSNSIEAIYEDIRFIADVTNQSDKGEEIVNSMKEEIEEISEIGKTITDKKTVYFEMNPEPHLYSIGKGTFIHEMIEIIGAENIFADEESWISVSGESIVEYNPDVILTNVGFVETPVEDVLNREGFEGVKAVMNNDVYLIDTDSSSRPSQNIVKALKEMAVAVYPEYYE